MSLYFHYRSLYVDLFVILIYYLELRLDPAVVLTNA